ncbi:MAG: hypothetical protein JWO52_6440 [Gammaproteobacteria bacterium]|nr:hypothetical protein [Gammaproteobacteria bacterium]
MRADHFRESPYAWLDAHVLATMKASVKAGYYKNREQAVQRLSGFFADVEHIATHAS